WLVPNSYLPGAITPTVAGSCSPWKAIDFTLPSKYSLTLNIAVSSWVMATPQGAAGKLASALQQDAVAGGAVTALAAAVEFALRAPFRLAVEVAAGAELAPGPLAAELLPAAAGILAAAAEVVAV